MAEKRICSECGKCCKQMSQEGGEIQMSELKIVKQLAGTRSNDG